MEIVHNHYKKRDKGESVTEERKRFANPERIMYHQTERKRVLDQIMNERTGQIEMSDCIINLRGG